MSILEVKGVSIRYKIGDFREIGLKDYVIKRLKRDYHVREFWADRNITFSLEKGDMLGIIGSNGAGKSTLLKAIAGIMTPTEGTVESTGNVAALLELASGFDPDLTVKENAYLRGAMLGYTRGFMDATYDHIIDFAELREFENRPFKQLSSGMKSRLAFSIASLVQPDILILDEVLSVGDGSFRKKSEEKMREIISNGATTILVSHSLQQVKELCNKVLWLEKGQQIAFGNTQIICSLYQQYLDKKFTLEEAQAICSYLNEHYDYLVVGAGLFGSTFAYEAQQRGKRCLVIDARPFIGGNAYAELKDDVTVQLYGAHCFHTNDESIWNYVNSFVPFKRRNYKMAVQYGKSLVPLPLPTISKASELNGSIINGSLDDYAKVVYGEDSYASIIRPYLEKEWIRLMKDIPTSALDEFAIAGSGVVYQDRFQGVPDGGCGKLAEAMLKDIPTITGLSYQMLSEAYPDIADKILFTGSIDVFFDYSIGDLEYRTLRFEEDVMKNVTEYQPYAEVWNCNTDEESRYIRILEHKHLFAENPKSTIVTYIYPQNWGPGRAQLWPVRDKKNLELYERYQKLAEEHPNVIFAGRLGEYKFYSMAETVKRARELAQELD